MRYSMNIDELSDASGISKRRLKDLHKNGLIHSPLGDLWPEDNLELISIHAGSRQDKWIHKMSMRSSLIRSCLSGNRSSSDHEVLTNEICQDDLLYGFDSSPYKGIKKELSSSPLNYGRHVLLFAKNDNSYSTIDEVVFEYLGSHGGIFSSIPPQCIVDALELLDDGYLPCWVRNSGGGFRTTIDMVGDLQQPTPIRFGHEHVLAALPVFIEVCKALGIAFKVHPEPKRPDALLTSKAGQNWCINAVFRGDDGKMHFETIGMLL